MSEIDSNSDTHLPERTFKHILKNGTNATRLLPMSKRGQLTVQGKQSWCCLVHRELCLFLRAMPGTAYTLDQNQGRCSQELRFGWNEH